MLKSTFDMLKRDLESALKSLDAASDAYTAVSKGKSREYRETLYDELCAAEASCRQTLKKITECCIEALKIRNQE